MAKKRREKNYLTSIVLILKFFIVSIIIKERHSFGNFLFTDAKEKRKKRYLRISILFESNSSERIN